MNIVKWNLARFSKSAVVIRTALILSFLCAIAVFFGYISSNAMADLPPEVEKIEVSDVTNEKGSLLVTWEPVHEGNISGYHIYRNLQEQNSTLSLNPVHSVSVNDTKNGSWIDSGIDDNVVYYYAVSAFDQFGNELRNGTSWVKGVSIDDVDENVGKTGSNDNEISTEKQVVLISLVLLIILALLGFFILPYIINKNTGKKGELFPVDRLVPRKYLLDGDADLEITVTKRKERRRKNRKKDVSKGEDMKGEKELSFRKPSAYVKGSRRDRRKPRERKRGRRVSAQHFTEVDEVENEEEWEVEEESLEDEDDLASDKSDSRRASQASERRLRHEKGKRSVSLDISAKHLTEIEDEIWENDEEDEDDLASDKSDSRRASQASERRLRHEKGTRSVSLDISAKHLTEVEDEEWEFEEEWESDEQNSNGEEWENDEDDEEFEEEFWE